MQRILIASLVAGAVTLAPAIAPAQGTCPAGRTAAGACVNASLASAARLTSILLSQPKISEAALPILPSVDADHRYPNQFNPSPLKPAPSTGSAP